MTSNSLQQVLSDRATQALARAEQLAAGVPDLRSASAVTQVELEQALDDADRYLSLADRVGGVKVRSEPRTYRPDGEHSFLLDLARRNDLVGGASDRLARHASEMSLERRDVTTVSFGGLVPPAYVAEVFAAASGPGRVFADLIGSNPLPSKGNSIMSGRVTSGAAAGGSAENSATTTDVSLADHSTAVRDYNGQVTVSAQFIERGDAAADRALAQELGLAIGRALDSDMLNSDGTNDRVLGVTQVSGVNAVAYGTTPAAPTFVSTLGNAAVQAAAGRGLPPDVILMHSRRWFWLTSQSSLPATVKAERPDGAPGSVIGTIHGLWVALDDNIPTTLGAGTNEDRVIVTRLDNFDLMEGGVNIRVPRTSVESATYTAILDVAFVPDRYPAGISVVSGTGLAAPSW